MGQLGVENERVDTRLATHAPRDSFKDLPAQVCTQGNVSERWEFPMSGGGKKNIDGRKQGNVKEMSFNGAGERAVRGTVVAQQMKIDTDN